jgi:hypothetical protein
MTYLSIDPSVIAPGRRHHEMVLGADRNVELEVQPAARGRLRPGRCRWSRRRGDPPALGLAAHRDGLLIHAGHSYPIPSIERNAALETIHAYLGPRNIFSRGRFGSWMYEIGNQDHSLTQGVELVDRWLDGSEENPGLT